ncbi:MAG: thioredoxin [Clostridia bacterium]|nr:thioredoxin [Clostridia bacterium]
MRELTNESFDAALRESDDLILVDFWASWCGPCRMIAPTLEELDREVEGFRVCKVNVDENPALADRFGIEAIPTLLFFRKGEPLKKKMGLYPKDGLMLIIKELMG